MRFFSKKRPTLPPLANLPILVNYLRAWQPSCEIEEVGGKTILVQQGWQEATEDDEYLYGNPSSLYDGLQAANTPQAAADFLSQSGPWLRWEQDRPGPESRRISWDEFREWQNYFQRVKLREPAEPPHRGRLGWGVFTRGVRTHVGLLEGFTIEVLSTGKVRLLVAKYQCESAAEAISAAIQIERLQGVEYRRCAFDGCRLGIFKLGYRRDKRFCDETCQHAAGQRRRRRKQHDEEAGPSA